VRLAADILVAFVAVYPVVTAGIWTAGGVLFRALDEQIDLRDPPGGWPGVTILVPAFNEEAVIGACVQHAREVDYPELEILVLDDGSTDGTVVEAAAAAEGDPRVEVVHDPVNRARGSA
jgi:biofilm PGA synthesis N-glycosyltransferase PgaC